MSGFEALPPVIDCSGWVALLIFSGMKAVEVSACTAVFSPQDILDVRTWSDRMIEVLECQSGSVLEGNKITLSTIPPYATIGLQQGGGTWAANHPHPRGITHVVQIASRPNDGELFVSEAQGWSEPHGLRLMPLADWLHATQPYLKMGKAWAVDPFALQQARIHGDLI